MPSPRESMSAVFDGTNIYGFGGSEGSNPLNTLRYSPGENLVSVMTSKFPFAGYGTSAVWDGKRAYIFGGRSSSGSQDTIVRYDPAKDEIRVMSARLPSRRAYTSAVWDGNFAYVFGGLSGANVPLADVVRYDPSTDEAVVLPSNLPSARYGTSAVWAGQAAYVFGGYGGPTSPPSYSYLDQIVRFDPGTGSISAMNGFIPNGGTGTSAAWIGNRAYVSGGFNGTWSGRISSFDPMSDSATTVASLPFRIDKSAAVATATEVVILGGYSPGSGQLDSVISFDPETNAARVKSYTLPAESSGTSAASNGQRTFIFGGSGYNSSGQYRRSSGILNYDATGNDLSVATATLPSARSGTAAAWLNGKAYIFGGSTDVGPTSEVLSFDPQTNAVTTMNAQLPAGLWLTSAVSDGSGVFLFGGEGSSPSDLSDEILRYDPGTDTLIKMAARLPTPRSRTSAVFDGRYAYIFGGWDGTLLGTILRYESSSDSVTTLGASLPSPRYGTSAVWDGYSALVFGGKTSSVVTSQVVKFDPATGSAIPTTAYLPSGASHTSAVSFGANSVVFGAPERTAIRYSGLPGAPPGFGAGAGPGAGQITLSWVRPQPGNFSGPLLGYRLYRRTVATEPFSMIASVGDVTSFVDSGIPEGTTRLYAITAVTGLGEGSMGLASARAFARPTAPSGLQASPGPFIGQTTITWNVPSFDGGTSVTAYRVYRGANSGGERFLAQVTGARTFVDTGCAVGLCFYKVTAVNIVGEGPFSNEAFTLGTAVP